MSSKQISGKVYLVGAGPGDPDLITVKAKRLIEECDALVYDALVSEEFITWTQSNCQLVYVGKRAGSHTCSQGEIENKLINLAQQGKMVVRLKGGDPFIFGRGGEEMIHLNNLGIEFEIVPAVTASIAAGAYTGTPLTHRGISSAVCMITGHERADGPSKPIDWASYAKLDATLCLYMSVKKLGEISRQLIEAGMDPNMPAMIVERASTSKQRSITGNISKLNEKALKAKITHPALIVIGKTIELQTEWYSPESTKNQSTLIESILEEAKQTAVDIT